MKTMSKIFGIVTVLTLTLFLTSSTIAPPPPGNNGVNVEVVKGQGWYLNTCSGPVYRESSTTQYKNGVLHMRTNKYSLPAGHCAIPSKATKHQIAPGYTILYTPSGMVIAKQVYN